MNKNRIIALLAGCNLLLFCTVVAHEFHVFGEPHLISSATAAPAALSTRTTNTATAHTTVSRSRRTEIVDAAEKAKAAIVSVGATTNVYRLRPTDNFFSDFALSPEQEKIPYRGSGVIVSSDGIIVTNHHVVDKVQGIFVTLTDGRELPAKLLDADTMLDVALLKVDEKDLPALRMGDSNSLMVGEWVLAMGNPFGNLIGDPTPTVTVGVVSALKRSFRPSDEMQRVYQDMIQTDAAINPGNSGGALINCDGELVGINTFIMSRSGGAEGIGFAIPVNRVKSVVEEIVQHGHVRSRLMDFRVQDMDDSLARRLRTTLKQGAVITEMARGGPAEKSGLKQGDIITGVDGQPVKSAETFLLHVWTQPVGTVVSMDISRMGKPVSLKYELTEAER